MCTESPGLQNAAMTSVYSAQEQQKSVTPLILLILLLGVRRVLVLVRDSLPCHTRFTIHGSRMNGIQVALGSGAY